jgi:undecaprenyl-diphosphatase
MDFIYQLDVWLFVALNSLAGQWPWLDTPARLFLNDYFVPTIIAITLLALWFEGTDSSTIRTSNQRAVLVGALSAVLVNVLVKISNVFYFRPRPFHTYKVNLLFYQPIDSSFPSNAAALGFSVAAGVWFYQRRWGWFLFSVAAIFGLSRIFGGVHYPLDVVAGATLGCMSAWIIHKQQYLINKLLALLVAVTKKLSLP